MPRKNLHGICLITLHAAGKTCGDMYYIRRWLRTCSVRVGVRVLEHFCVVFVHFVRIGIHATVKYFNVYVRTLICVCLLYLMQKVDTNENY